MKNEKKKKKMKKKKKKKEKKQSKRNQLLIYITQRAHIFVVRTKNNGWLVSS